jgi:hypothetical protein
VPGFARATIHDDKSRGTPRAADVTEAELMQAAIALAQQYDANYAAKNYAGMAALCRLYI